MRSKRRGKREGRYEEVSMSMDQRKRNPSTVIRR